MEDIEIYETRPKDFNPKVQVSGCFIEIDGKLLLLQRHKNIVDGGTWGIPGGKLEMNETPQQGALRELKEETGICIELDAQLSIFGTLYMRKPNSDFVFYLFKVQLDKKPNICLSNEHSTYTWASLEDFNKLNLMPGGIEVLKKYYQHSKVQCTGLIL